MLKFIKHNLYGIENVELYPMISLLIFFGVFVGMFVYVAKMPKPYIEDISQLPLEDDSINNEEKL